MSNTSKAFALQSVPSGDTTEAATPSADLSATEGQTTPSPSKVIYDIVEAEYEKDIWDLKVIPGCSQSIHDNRQKLNFLRVPAVFRPAVKRYLRFVLGRCSSSHALNLIRHVANFLEFYTANHPDAQDLTDMVRGDVEAYLTVVRAHTDTFGRTTSEGRKYLAIMYLENWIIHQQRVADPCAPQAMVSRLFWPEDRGLSTRRQGRYSSRLKPKYIPDFVLRQVDEHLHEFMPLAYRPVVLLMRASGWRISDIMNLRLKTCLEKTGKHWWLCGDIPKTRVDDHKVPITDDVAKIVLAQRNLVEVNYRPSTNPLGLLFPAISLERQGRGLRREGVNRAIRTFIRKHNIRDEQGKLYHFSTHAFRHTKAVELINNGMPLSVVQQWLAHSSPEMTLVYARMLDTTMRDKWEEAMRQGALRIDESGVPKPFNPLASKDKGEIEWEYIRHNLDAVRLPNGYCFKPNRFQDCPTQAIPCHTCHNFCTTPDFLPQFEAQRQGILIQIDLGRSANRQQWVDRNERLLEPVDRIINTLEGGSVHHPAGKAGREYSQEDWDKLPDEKKGGQA